MGKILEKDFTNLIMFCRKSKAAFGFRKPVQADFLGSQARKDVLVPEYEIQAGYFERTSGPDLRPAVLRRGDTARLVGLQQRNALNHWHIMRTVIPGVVWENW